MSGHASANNDDSAESSQFGGNWAGMGARLGPATKALMVALVFLFVLGQILPVAVLSLVPGFTLNWYFWNWFTAGFVERSVFSLVLDLLVVAFCGSELEPLWGATEFAKFVCVTSGAAGMTTYILAFVVYALTFSEDFWFNTAFGGFVGVSAAFTVALKQQTPETTISILGLFSLKIKHMPLIVVGLNIFFLVIGAPMEAVPFSLLGVWFGWVYLRFFQRLGDGTVGDMSDSFSLASLFPLALQPAITTISTLAWTLSKPLHRFGPCTEQLPLVTSELEHGHRLGGLDDSAPAVVDLDAERRRARAIAALDERLQIQEQQQKAASRET